MISPTLGKLSMQDMIESIKNYIEKCPNSEYKITIGSDSQNTQRTKVVMVLAIWRVGKGGIFFYEVHTIPKIVDLKEKIYYETNKSLEFAQEVVRLLEHSGIDFVPEIHVDIGVKGKTCELIHDIVEWVTDRGYICKIKPNSYAASWVANKITK